MSQDAYRTISASEVLVGYSTYIKLLGGLTVGKEVIASGMTKEIERAQAAIKKALEGKTVSIISSGDPGVYGMAGACLELLRESDADEVDLEIIPGIISATASAALLGAPLMNDFATISLSDLMTGWNEIKKRIVAAADSDFVIVLYNPKSRTRIKPFARALDIMKRRRSPETPVGVVRNAYRRAEAVKILRLKDVAALKDIDMVTTVIIGNSMTYVKNGYMVTPRGYNFKKTIPEKGGEEEMSLKKCQKKDVVKNSSSKSDAISYRLKCAKTANGLSHFVMYGDVPKKKTLV